LGGGGGGVEVGRSLELIGDYSVQCFLERTNIEKFVNFFPCVLLFFFWLSLFGRFADMYPFFCYLEKFPFSQFAPLIILALFFSDFQGINSKIDCCR